jgi:hypothetical protein
MLPRTAWYDEDTGALFESGAIDDRIDIVLGRLPEPFSHCQRAENTEREFFVRHSEFTEFESHSGYGESPADTIVLSPHRGDG